MSFIAVWPSSVVEKNLSTVFSVLITDFLKWKVQLVTVLIIKLNALASGNQKVQTDEKV
jgi:hypothetical protein